MASMTRSMPLPGPRRPQVSNVGDPDRPGFVRVVDGRRAVRDRAHLGRIDVEAVHQTASGPVGHDDDLVGHRGHRHEHGALVGGGIGEDGVGDDDGRNPQLLEHAEDLVAVVAAVDAVLVLDDGHVTAVDQLRALARGPGGAGHQLADDAVARRRGAIGHPDDVDRGAEGGETVGQGGAEGGQPARRRWVGADDREGAAGTAVGGTGMDRCRVDAQVNSFRVTRVEASNLHGATARHDGRPAQARRLSQGGVRLQGTGSRPADTQRPGPVTGPPAPRVDPDEQHCRGSDLAPDRDREHDRVTGRNT